jgi:hypothetical protein
MTPAPVVHDLRSLDAETTSDLSRVHEVVDIHSSTHNGNSTHGLRQWPSTA